MTLPRRPPIPTTITNDEGKCDMKDLKDSGLPKKVVTALEEQGIDTIPKLCSFTLDDIGVLEGIGPKALLDIAKLKEAVGVHPQGTTAAAPPSETAGDEKYMTQEPPPELATITTKTFEIKLQFRHAEWITRAAEAYAMSEEQVIEQAIRQAYQRDPYKAGATAVSGSILKHDNPHTQK